MQLEFFELDLAFFGRNEKTNIASEERNILSRTMKELVSY